MSALVKKKIKIKITIEIKKNGIKKGVKKGVSSDAFFFLNRKPYKRARDQRMDQTLAPLWASFVKGAL